MKRWRRSLWRILMATGAAALVVGGIVAVGQFLRDDLRSRERYQVSIGDIDCDPPQGQTRSEFLDEVHFYGQLSEKLSTLDPALPDKLRAAFSRHPRVKQIDKVTISPPRRVRVEVIFNDQQQDGKGKSE